MLTCLCVCVRVCEYVRVQRPPTPTTVHCVCSAARTLTPKCRPSCFYILPRILTRKVGEADKRPTSGNGVPCCWPRQQISPDKISPSGLSKPIQGLARHGGAAMKEEGARRSSGPSVAGHYRRHREGGRSTAGVLGGKGRKGCTVAGEPVNEPVGE